MNYFIANTKMVKEECCNCGIMFAITENFKIQKKENHASFYCPNGHEQYYPAKNETEILKERLKTVQSCCTAAREEANSLDRSRKAYKGHLTRLKAKLSR